MSEDDFRIDPEREIDDRFILENETVVEVHEPHRNYKATALRNSSVISRSMSPNLDCSIVLESHIIKVQEGARCFGAQYEAIDSSGGITWKLLACSTKLTYSHSGYVYSLKDHAIRNRISDTISIIN